MWLFIAQYLHSASQHFWYTIFGGAKKEGGLLLKSMIWGGLLERGLKRGGDLIEFYSIWFSLLPLVIYSAQNHWLGTIGSRKWWFILLSAIFLQLDAWQLNFADLFTFPNTSESLLLNENSANWSKWYWILRTCIFLLLILLSSIDCCLP